MSKYLFKRILISLATLLLIVFILFILLQFMPGSPFNDERITPEQRELMNIRYGLDKPVLVQFVNYVKNMLTGDLGVSYSISRDVPVTTLLQSRLPVSFELGFWAVIVGTLSGLIFGTIAAFNQNSIWDTISTLLSVIGVSVPSYVFALGLSYYFGFQWRIFPILFNLNDKAMSMVLPVISLSLFTMASIARFTRTEMIEVLQSDYIQLAESKGVTGSRLLFKHVLRNASIPILTVLAPLIVGLMTGSMVVEQIFSIPGLGQLLVQAIQSNDFNIVMGISFIYSALFIFVMLVVDILYGILDPRIRVTGGE
ncbi:ABC transporter permease subunit [Aerococcaceae bacterium DSM 109653]|uniref:ABC transporter permease subunit n=1 Tax=Fundicoccus ignavus TaxID=2664442 RepID=A0A6I2GFX6_9LACT|nr:ABC transporter permease [Fundicoccus ignavus]MRI81015.1 ABC transporter permease subunit [Fundicoccus ignavus]MRI86086.1 ABC transporter permease subunit [Fundicoccus ignavus]